MQRLAVLFAVMYFAQGMWALPNLSLQFFLKEHLRLSPAEVAAFFAMATVPWYVKPLYGLISDLFPLWGYRRKSYLLLSTGVGVFAALALGGIAPGTYWLTLGFFTLVTLSVASSDVLVDGLMVEKGQPLGMTGTLQAVQWASVSTALAASGVVGGYLAQYISLSATFLATATFPAAVFFLVLWAVRETGRGTARKILRQTSLSVSDAIRSRSLWLVTGFLFFWSFSPSFGPALLYYMTDELAFSRVFIGILDSAGAASAVLGASLYFLYANSFSLETVVKWSIALGVAGTLAYLGLTSPLSALVVYAAFGLVNMVAQLAMLDLAARACPPGAEATFFALLMSVLNISEKASSVVGSWLYTRLGYTGLVLISAMSTAAAFLLVPLLPFERLESRPD